MSEVAPSSGLSPGTKVDHFKVVRLLGKGGMGAVYLAEDQNLGRPVALKILSPALFEVPGYRERFIREARSAARLNHPNIVQVYHFGESGGRPYFAMEYVEGLGLDAVIEKQGALPPRTAVHLVLQVVEGLTRAAEAGVIHRDLKPANLILGKDKRVRILDFGLARTAESTSMTQSGTVMGTPDYMSPEQARGQTTSLTTDVYALGIVLYQLLAGELPFRGTSAVDVMMQHIQARPPRIETLVDNLPAELIRILYRCIEKDPKDRYAAYPALSADLQACFQLLPDKVKKAAPRMEAPPAPAPPGAPASGPTMVLASPDRSSDTAPAARVASGPTVFKADPTLPPTAAPVGSGTSNLPVPVQGSGATVAVPVSGPAPVAAGPAGPPAPVALPRFPAYDLFPVLSVHRWIRHPLVSIIRMISRGDPPPSEVIWTELQLAVASTVLAGMLGGWEGVIRAVVLWFILGLGFIPFALGFWGISMISGAAVSIWTCAQIVAWINAAMILIFLPPVALVAWLVGMFSAFHFLLQAKHRDPAMLAEAAR